MTPGEKGSRMQGTTQGENRTSWGTGLPGTRRLRPEAALGEESPNHHHHYKKRCVLEGRKRLFMGEKKGAVPPCYHIVQ